MQLFEWRPTWKTFWQSLKSTGVKCFKNLQYRNKPQVSKKDGLLWMFIKQSQNRKLITNTVTVWFTLQYNYRRTFLHGPIIILIRPRYCILTLYSIMKPLSSDLWSFVTCFAKCSTTIGGWSGSFVGSPVKDGARFFPPTKLTENKKS